MISVASPVSISVAYVAVLGVLSLGLIVVGLFVALAAIARYEPVTAANGRIS